MSATRPPHLARESKRQRTRTQRLLEQITATVQAMDSDGVSVGDLKIVARALQEMRAAFAMFAPYRDSRKVSTFGSARTQEHDAIFRTAENFARAIADAGFMVVTGAGGGIMEACQRGAGRERSFGVNIVLPFEKRRTRSSTATSNWSRSTISSCASCFSSRKPMLWRS